MVSVPILVLILATAGVSEVGNTPSRLAAVTVPVGDAPTSSAAEAAKSTSSWYGWYFLASDVALVTVGLAIPWEAGGIRVPFLAVPLTGPTVHFIHGHSGAALASLGLRIGLPLSGLVTGLFIGGETGILELAGAGAVVGLAVGLVGAEAFDAAMLAYDEPGSTGSVGSYESEGIQVQPVVSVGPTGTMFGIAGRI